MRVGIMCLVLATLVAPAHAGTIVITFTGTPVTVTTTPKQDKELERQLQRENNQRAQQTPPLVPLTLEQYVEYIVTSGFVSEEQTAGQADMRDGCAFFKAQPEGQQASTIATQFGGYPPCP